MSIEALEQPAVETELTREPSVKESQSCPKCKKPTMRMTEDLGLVSEKCPCGHSDMYST